MAAPVAAARPGSGAGRRRGALAAAFNTPVAAVLFALEEIIGDMNAALLGSTVVASVAAVDRRALDPRQRAAVSRADLSPRASGRTDRRTRRSASSAASCRWCSARGCSGCARLFLRLPPRRKVVPAGHRRPGHRRACWSYSPAIMGVGYEYVDQALNGGLLLKTMALLCVSEARRDHRVVRVGQRRRHFRAEPVHRRDGRRRGRHWSCTASRRFRPAIPAPTRWSGWERCSPASFARR